MSFLFKDTPQERIAKMRKRQELLSGLEAQISTKHSHKSHKSPAGIRIKVEEEGGREEESSPWGRPGAGAPLRDESGRILTNLKPVITGDTKVAYSPLSPKPSAIGKRKKEETTPGIPGLEHLLSPAPLRQVPAKKDRKRNLAALQKMFDDPSAVDNDRKRREREKFVADLEAQVREKERLKVEEARFKKQQQLLERKTLDPWGRPLNDAAKNALRAVTKDSPPSPQPVFSTVDEAVLEEEPQSALWQRRRQSDEGPIVVTAAEPEEPPTRKHAPISPLGGVESVRCKLEAGEAGETPKMDELANLCKALLEEQRQLRQKLHSQENVIANLSTKDQPPAAHRPNRQPERRRRAPEVVQRRRRVQAEKKPVIQKPEMSAAERRAMIRKKFAKAGRAKIARCRGPAKVTSGVAPVLGVRKKNPILPQEEEEDALADAIRAVNAEKLEPARWGHAVRTSQPLQGNYRPDRSMSAQGVRGGGKKVKIDPVIPLFEDMPLRSESRLVQHQDSLDVAVFDGENSLDLGPELPARSISVGMAHGSVFRSRKEELHVSPQQQRRGVSHHPRVKNPFQEY